MVYWLAMKALSSAACSNLAFDATVAAIKVDFDLVDTVSFVTALVMLSLLKTLAIARSEFC